jgi:GGDEF domain-containing protein
MDPGFTELQVIIGVSVVLGLGFLALVFEYMRSNTASLREYNIELQVRQEEREKHKPLEAVEWLQHLLGAKQGTIRVTQGRRAQPASMKAGQAVAQTKTATHARPAQTKPAMDGEQTRDRFSPAETVTPAAVPVTSAPAAAVTRGGEPPVPRTAPAPATGSPEAPAASVRRPSPMEVTRPIQTKPLDVPSVISPAPMTAAHTTAASITGGAESNERGSERKPALVLENTTATKPPAGHRSLLAEGRARGDQDRTATASNLLATLPMPEWLRKEQEEKAAARARRESSVQKTNELVEVALQRLRSGSSALAAVPASGAVTTPDGLADKAHSTDKAAIDKAAAAARTEASGTASVSGSAGAGTTSVGTTTAVPSVQTDTSSLREPLKETQPAASPVPVGPVAQIVVELSPADRARTDQGSTEQAPQIAIDPTPQVAVSKAQTPESFWNYRGLLDQVVAATGERIPQQAAASEIHEVGSLQPAAEQKAQEEADPVSVPEAPEVVSAKPKAVSAETSGNGDGMPELIVVEVAAPVSSDGVGLAQQREIAARALPVAIPAEQETVRVDDLPEERHRSNGAMEIATVTMDVPEHPMQDAIDSETSRVEEPLVLLVEESPRQVFAMDLGSPTDAPILSTPVTASFLPQAPALETESGLLAESGWTHTLPVEGASHEAITLAYGGSEAVQPTKPGLIEETGPTVPDSPSALEAYPSLAAREDSSGFAAEAIAPMENLALPAGFHPPAVLEELLKSTAVVNGVVVVIGINDYSLHSERMGKPAMQEWMVSVEAMIRSLLSEKDFGCRSSEDEFVLVFPGETGIAAQRRLNMISERLWSFQLRSLGAFSVMFSWGAVEIQGETLADATASASERMYQTKRNRKTVSLESGRSRKAVNL